MSAYLLHHHHEAHECGVAYAAWKGFESPLRHGRTLASCRSGAHEIWWVVEAPDADMALAQLPHYVAVRTVATMVAEVVIP